MQRPSLAAWILSASLAIVFGWFGIEKFVAPDNWISWMPAWMDGLLGQPLGVWLVVVGAAEILFAVMLLVPVRGVRRAGAVLVALQLLAILPIAYATEPTLMLRDFAMMASAVALAMML